MKKSMWLSIAFLGFSKLATPSPVNCLTVLGTTCLVKVGVRWEDWSLTSSWRTRPPRVRVFSYLPLGQES